MQYARSMYICSMHAVCMQYARSMYAVCMQYGNHYPSTRRLVDSTTRRLVSPSTLYVYTRVRVEYFARHVRAGIFLGPYVITRSGIFSLGPGIFSVISRSARVIFLLVAPEAGLRRVLFYFQ